MRIEIVRGAEADALLADATFRAQWEMLCGRCPWATVFQSPRFAATWYSVYRNHYEPLLALARRDGAGDRLRGILPLAVSQTRRELGVAGLSQAEYQGWACEPGVADEFPWEALSVVREQVSWSTPTFTYLPARTPLGWASTRTARRVCLVRTFRRPIMRFDEEVEKSLAKRGNKGKLRRLGKHGKVEFRRLNTAAEVAPLFDAIKNAYDLRRVAVNGDADFADDPLKQPFHMALMDVPGLLHATALTAGDVLASAQLNFRESRYVHLSLIMHNPLVSMYSPGKYHLLLLARMLMGEGYEYMDLTPGGDPFKQRFANDYEEVHSLGVFAGAPRRALAAVHGFAEDSAKRALRRLNVAPVQVRMFCERAARCRLTDLPRLLRAAASPIFSRSETRVYRRALQRNAIAPGAPQVRRDSIEDLLGYSPPHGWPTRQQFLADAERRFGDWQHSYTVSENGRLLHWAWVQEEPIDGSERPLFAGAPLPARSAAVTQFCTMPSARGRGLALQTLRAVLGDMSVRYDALYVAVPARSSASRRAVEKLGFSYQHSVFEQATLGRRRAWTEIVPPSPAPDETAPAGRAAPALSEPSG
jgi:CelD/BcsL family acetyltransferase involved in cellulose biosynthesis